MTTTIPREALAITAAALQVLARLCDEDAAVTIAGVTVKVSDILGEADRVLASPIPDEELAAYLNEPQGRIAALPEAERAALADQVADELTGIEAAAPFFRTGDRVEVSLPDFWVAGRLAEVTGIHGWVECDGATFGRRLVNLTDSSAIRREAIEPTTAPLTLKTMETNNG